MSWNGKSKEHKCPWCPLTFSTEELVQIHRKWGCPDRIVEMHGKGWTVERIMEYITMPRQYIQQIIDKAAKKAGK